ncbi:MAG: histidinol-phosphate transaminase [Deltaproteobacteria bacterium]|nr:histidinol-phosphate transaminase [Deltaproteobacteria bacterium]
MKQLKYRTAYGSVENLVPYQTGKPIEELLREMGLERIIKLASNENPMGMSPLARKAVQEALNGINRYPDGSAYHLKGLLAEKHGVPGEMIVLGNGSNEILELLAQLLLCEGAETVYAWPAFIVYRLCTLAHGGRGVEVPLDTAMAHDLGAMAEAVTPDTRIVFVANPNNPTGSYVARPDVERFLDALPEDVVPVLDEAYFEYAMDRPDYPDGIELVKQGRSLVVTRTFSKAYGLAGLRVGYAVMPEELADLLNRVRQPFNVNSLGQAAAAAALGDQEFIREAVRLNRIEMERVSDGVRSLGLSAAPSAGNFLLVDLMDPKGETVYQALLKNGVIVRPMAGYGLPGHLRVTIGNPDENKYFLEKLTEIMERNEG